jgi:iron complex transport system ATP-binding protein
VRTLSGGERRRVALAAVLAQDPPLWLLDEPAAHLDLGQQVDVVGVLADLARARGRTIVMVVHELHLALRYADHAIALGAGRAVAGAAAAILEADALSALFGHRLIAAGTGTARTFIPL